MLPDIPLLFIAELLALGVVVGFLAGLLGIGGGMMMVPTMTLLLTQRGVAGGGHVEGGAGGKAGRAFILVVVLGQVSPRRTGPRGLLPRKRGPARRSGRR